MVIIATAVWSVAMADAFIAVLCGVAVVFGVVAWRVKAAWGVVPALVGGLLVLVQYAFFPHQFVLFDSALDFASAIVSASGAAAAVVFGTAHLVSQRRHTSPVASGGIVRAYATAIGVVFAMAIASGVVDVVNPPATVSAAERDGAVIVRYKDFETKDTHIEAEAGKPIRIVVDNQDRIFHDFKVKDTNVKVDLGPKDEKLVVFTLTAGDYEYICTLHTEMKGEIIVK
jgi:plastocyanin